MCTELKNTETEKSKLLCPIFCYMTEVEESVQLVSFYWKCCKDWNKAL